MSDEDGVTREFITHPVGSVEERHTFSAEAWDRLTRLLPGYAFLDDDGTRVRFAHVCNGEPKVDRLPNSVWTWDAAGRVSPSIHCLTCAFHEFLTLREKPALLDAMERAVG